jgi:Cu(I)/Ag(I) efflux system membrane protein CusA/SilA
MSPLRAWLGFATDRRVVVVLLVALLTGYGLTVMPFDVDGTPLASMPRDPVPVDAIPDLGDKQQIVFTPWPGRSPQDVEDQVTYPLVSRLLGVPGVKTVRASSMFGFSSIYVIFDDDAEFYETRTRVLEKLSSIGGDLPPGVTPELGPDATGLGQVLWYTLEGEGFDLHELRTLQDYTLRYALLSVPGVSEVASVGGYVREIQVDVDPEALRAHNVTLADVERAVAGSNLDVGARGVELNGVEYLVRGKGYVTSPEDVARAVVRATDGTPLYVDQIADVGLGPAPRRGALDKAGAEVVGGVVTARFGVNPREVVDAVKARLDEIAPSLPKRTLADGTVSQVRVVPFYDRGRIIEETIGTLGTALIQQILITLLVVLVLLLEIRSAFLVAITLPIGVLLSLALMKVLGVDSNLMSLGGIIIAIGTMVDMGIVLTESMQSEIDEGKPVVDGVRAGAGTSGGAVLAAVATTVVSFLPVFAMTGPASRLFLPLAFTKTFALCAAIFVALVLLPALATWVLKPRGAKSSARSLVVRAVAFGVIGALVATLHLGAAILLWVLAVRAVVVLLQGQGALRLPVSVDANLERIVVVTLAVIVFLILVDAWRPLGFGYGFLGNGLFVAAFVGPWLLLLWAFRRAYPRALRWALAHKGLALSGPAALIAFGLLTWLGAPFFLKPAVKVLEPAGVELKATSTYRRLAHRFPGLKDEFMPPLDEGTFLYMPTLMPHAGIGEAIEVMQKQDRAFAAIPEVELVVGKLGRAETALDPAPLNMIETILEVKPEYGPVDPETGERVRNWREHIHSTDDVWSEIVKAAQFPGVTSAPKLMPIATRLVMLQTGMRANTGLKVRARTLDELQAATATLEAALKSVDGVDDRTVQPDRVIGKPYLELEIDRARAARYGVRVVDVQRVIETALGGRQVTVAVDGRERTPVRVRYQREERDNLEAMLRTVVPVAAPFTGSHESRASGRRAQVPLAQVASLEYRPGPMVIKSEDGFLVAYVTFGREDGVGEIEIVERAEAKLNKLRDDGALVVPNGVTWTFAGTYEQQVESERTLLLILPVALALIFAILLLQFRKALTAGLVFASIAVAWAGGFVFIWMWGGLEGAELSLFGVDVLGVLQPKQVALSTAVWVGFIALFGIASDDGVLMATYLDQTFEAERPTSRAAVREAVVEGALRRVRPCLMTTATTVLALLPVLTSTGRGSDVMTPMVLPTVGGMLFELVTLFVVPVLYCLVKEGELPTSRGSP